MHILYIYVQVVVGGAMLEREKAGGSGWRYAGREREQVVVGGAMQVVRERARIWRQSVASEWRANS